MQIWEGDQPVVLHQQQPQTQAQPGRNSKVVGGWCGATITPRFYFTESSSLTLVLRLSAVPPSLITAQQSSTHPVLDLNYKVIRRSSAIVR